MGVNLLAANSNTAGRASSGSGVWPADLSSPSPQYYMTKASPDPNEAWMGVADLVSPDPAETPVAQPATYPTGGMPLVGADKHFAASARAGDDSLSLVVNGTACSLTATVAHGEGAYALYAATGLTADGWYTAICGVVACQVNQTWDACVFEMPNGGVLPSGGQHYLVPTPLSANTT